MIINNLFEDKDKDPCWKGYKQIGMKEKNGKQVPNCVPESQTTNEVEHRFDEPLTGWHIVYRSSGNPVHGTPSFTSKDEAQKYLMTKMFANHHEFKVVHTAHVGVSESDISGLIHAAKHLDKSFIITAETAEGSTKKYRVRAQSERTAKEKFSKHYSQAEILSVKEEGVTEGDFDQWGGEIKTPTGKKQKYKITLPDGKVKKFVASNDQEAKSIARDYNGKNLTKLKSNISAEPAKDQGVVEGHADQQRKIVKKDGKPVGEVGIDRESSPGVGQYYMKHYASGKDLSGYDTMEEALAELKHYLKQDVAEATGDAKFDSMMSNITKKKLAVDRRTGQEYDPEEEFDKALKRHQAQFKGMTAIEKAQKKGVGESTNPQDKITVDVPLLLRLLEYAREDAQTDMDLHDVTEQLIKLSAAGKTLSMQDYDEIVNKEHAVAESALYPGEAHLYSVTFDDGTTADIEDPYDRGISDTVAKKYPGKKVVHIDYKGITGMGLSGGGRDTTATQKYQQQQRNIETQKQFARAERDFERKDK